jgi:hypothetical protein
VSRLGKGPVVVGLLVLGLLVVAVATRPWVGAGVDGGVLPGVQRGTALVATGSAVSPASALGLVVMACAGAMLLARRVVVTVLGALALLAALGAAWVALRVLLDPVTAVLPKVAEATGLTPESVDPSGVDASATSWAVAALVLALLTALVALVAVVRGRTWGATRRYERPDEVDAGSGGATTAADAAADDWDALSRGEDPTSGR